ncbi:MAG: hypothetical protein EZS28_013076, partial [Streblomastix strix]
GKVNGGVIWIALDCLWRIIYILHEGSNQCKPQHALLSYAEEKIEEFGGMEMCNSHLFHSEQQENIRLIAGWTQQYIINHARSFLCLGNTGSADAAKGTIKKRPA